MDCIRVAFLCLKASSTVLYRLPAVTGAKMTTGDTPSFPATSGPMADKVRGHDWAATPLGAIETWPAVLRIAVDMLLASAFPKCLFWGPDLIAIYNDAYVPLLGNKPESLGEPFLVTWPEAWDQMKPIIDRAWAGEATFIEDHLIPLDRFGKVEDAWFTFCYSPVRDAGGHVGGILDTVVETTQKVKLAREEANNQARFRALFDQSPTFMALVIGPEHRYAMANPGYLKLIDGRKVEGLTIAEALPEAVEQGYGALLDEVYRTGKPYTGYGARFTPKPEPGEPPQERILDFVYQPLANADGEIIGIFIEGADVTRRHTAEAALRELNESLERQIEERTASIDRSWRKSRDIQIVSDLSGIIRALNPAWEDVLGHKVGDSIGHHFTEFVWPEDRAATRELNSRARTRGDLNDVEFRFLHADGTPRWISWRATTEGEFIYSYGRDVTAEKKQAEALEHAEQALRQAQKMEAVGQLTGGIAHDFNNMLAVISGSLDLLTRRLGDGDPRAKRHVEAAAEAAKRAASLTQRLLAFSRQQPLRPEAINVNSLVAGMSDLLHRSLGSGIRLETVLAAGLWRVHADPNQLENVILNLSVNARDAMPDGGRLTIETQNAHVDDRYAANHLGVTAGQYVLVAISDTGHGMTPEVMAKAFDPFFTTKDVGKGTGLGLSQVYGFVKQSGGHVKIYSEPGQGTSVKIYLPRVTAAGGGDLGDAAEPVIPLGEAQEVVLVVDDEPAVRQFSVDALQELGYRVLEADGAAAALRLIDAHPDIDLLFTDIVMPDVNGRRLAEAAREKRPSLRVLYTTGYTRNAVVHNGVLDPGVELIGKPYSLDQLAAKVRQVLDAPAA